MIRSSLETSARLGILACASPGRVSGGILFFILLIYGPFVIPGILLNPYVVSLVSLTQFWGQLFFLSCTVSFLWIWHHVVGKQWNGQQILLAVISICLFATYVLVNAYYMYVNYFQ